jgi:hypothetical protein
MTTQFKVGDKVLAYVPGNNPKRGVLIDKADGFGWGIYKVEYTLHGKTDQILVTRIAHDTAEEGM